MATKRKPAKQAASLLPSPLQVRVRVNGGGYSVRARGKNATCAWSAATAVRRLAEKIGYKPGFDVARSGAATDGDGDIWYIIEVQP